MPPLIPTEQRNPRTVDIDLLSTEEMLRRINEADQGVAQAVAAAIPAITPVVDAITAALRQGGRLFYFGAGTSGRLGVLDASECPPTYGTDPWQVQGWIAGGDTALRNAVEGAEDSAELGRRDFQASQAGPGDVVVGISASGGAAYVVAVLEAARHAGCFTAAVTAHATSPLAQVAHQAVVVDTGPEVVAGSTRMKAGTAQKLVLNMLTTGAMIQLGKTYENWMVDVRPTNEKLKLRARRIVGTLAGVSEAEAEAALAAAGNAVKPAVLMLRLGLSLPEAEARLTAAQGKLRKALAPSD